MSGLIDRWLVTIVCEYSNGKIQELDFEVEGSIFNATRLVNTYKPKRGWKAISFRIDKGLGLV